MKILAGLAAGLAVTIITVSSYASDRITKVTYKWTDENGIVQFTERPPRNRAYEKIIVTASGGQEVQQVSEEQATNEAKEEVADPISEIQKANERNCQVARQNMDVLNNISRIRVTENGEERILSPEEKAQRVQETQRAIDTFCKPAADTQ